MSVAGTECPLCWVIAHAQGNPDGADEWLRTATCIRDNLVEMQEEVGAFCGEASYALAYLIDGTVVLGAYQFEGKPSEFPNPHYWVEKEGYIIDPTAEQYGEFEGPIVIKTGDKHYVYTEDTFRDDPWEVRRLIERGFIDPAISMHIIEDLLKAQCTAGIGFSNRNSMSLTLTKEEKEDYDHFVNDAARKIYVFLRVKRGLTHEDALGHLEEYAQWGEIPGVPSPLGRGEPVDNEIRALFGLPPIKGNPTRIRPEIEAMAVNNPFIHVPPAAVKETFIHADHPVAIVDVFEFGGMWNPVNRLVMFDAKTWRLLDEEEKRILLDHEIVERELAMEDYAQYRSHSAAVEANHAKANAIVSERYGADAIEDLIARELLDR